MNKPFVPEPNKINLCSMPTNLHRAIGYPGSSDWLGVYWSPYGDELAWYDGITEFVGANYWAFLEWVRSSIAWNGKLNLIGDSNSEATWHLVLDIKNEDVYLMRAANARGWVFTRKPDISIFEAGLTHAFATMDEFQIMVEDIVNSGIQPSTILSKAVPCKNCEGMSGYIFDRENNRFDCCSDCKGSGWVQHLDNNKITE